MVYNSCLHRGVTAFKVNITFFKYLKTTDGLPDPKGSLSSSMQPQAIAQANKEVRVARYSGLINFVHTSWVRNFFKHINLLHETFVTQKFPNLW